MQQTKTMSWGWVIFWCVIFWPVGIFFLFKKLSSDKAATLQSSKKVSIISYVLLFIGIVGLFSKSSDGSSSAGVAVLFIAGGIWLLIIARNMKINGVKYKKYINLVINQHVTDIDNIAASMGVTYTVASRDLQKMIDSGYFTGGFINVNTREIVLLNSNEVSSTQTNPSQAQTRVVACKSCGANNTVVAGKNNVCEYCGSPLL